MRTPLLTGVCAIAAIAVAIGSAGAGETVRDSRYPAHWWTPVSKEGAPDWEILPQEAGPGEVILSKRNELGLLSNFAATPFTFHGKQYASIEGFWQMMKFPEDADDPRSKFPGLEWKFTREQVAQMTGFDAKHAGDQANENMKTMGIDWVTFEGMRYFSGGGKDLDSMDSTCQPTFGFVSEGEFLVTACDVWGGWDVAAWSTGGNRLWAVRTTDREIWPLLVSSLDGTRVARETVVLNHPIKGRRARVLNPEDVKGQVVRVFDAADGMVALESPATPTLDAGGNVAISPSGRRVAVLNDGAIQVFELPAPAPLPKSVRDHSRR